jgi:hypothetical protein
MPQLNTRLRDDCTGPAVTVVPGRLRGYRWFSYNSRSPLGIGAVRLNQSREGLPWSHTMKARCYPNKDSHRWYSRSNCQAPNPDEAHWCGLYGWYSPDRIDLVRDLNVERAVLGVVEAWGNVLMGDQGFRAEHVRILALAFVPEARTIRICRQRGIAVYQEDDALIADWQPDNVGDLHNVAVVTEGQALHAHSHRLIARISYMQRRSCLESIERHQATIDGYAQDLAQIDRIGESYRGERVQIQGFMDRWQSYLDREIARLERLNRRAG